MLSPTLEIKDKPISADVVLHRLKEIVTESRWNRIQQVVASRSYQIAPVLENIYDRGNVSAVMRSAEAYGFINFHIVERDGASFKAANRVTKGTDKWLDIYKHKTPTECAHDLQSFGYRVYATHLDATTSIDEIDFTQPTAVVLGNEKDGVSQEMLDLADGTFILPMHGFAQSFNISVAAAIIFSHIFSVRRAQQMDSDLNDNEKQLLTAQYLLRSVANPHVYF